MRVTLFGWILVCGIDIVDHHMPAGPTRTLRIAPVIRSTVDDVATCLHAALFGDAQYGVFRAGHYCRDDHCRHCNRRERDGSFHLGPPEWVARYRSMLFRDQFPPGLRCERSSRQQQTSVFRLTVRALLVLGPQHWSTS